MRKLRIQFSLFFILLAAATGFVLYNSYRQLASEEQQIWHGASEKVFNRMQAVVSEFLTAEDRRPPAEYQSPSSTLTALSPDDPRGLIGYFQLAPGGHFTTPQTYLKETIEDLTSSLRLPVAPSKPKGFVELGRLDEATKQPIRDMDDAFESKDKEAGYGSSITGYRSAQNIYPNPVQEQAVRLERKRNLSAKAAPPPPPPASVPPVVNLIPEVSTDPFQARLVSDRYILFYRKVWIDQRPHFQGFVVELERFFSWLMDQSFANSDLPDFALARLDLAGRTLAQYGIVKLGPQRSHLLFDRGLGYPLNLFNWRVEADHLPRLGTRLFLNVMAGAIALLITLGLFLIYRSAAAQVVLSQKRQDFVSAVTHELKTPLTSIRMYSEMLEDGWAKDEQKKLEYYSQISRESGRLSRLIENILQLARLEKKTYKVALKESNPQADFTEIGSELKKIAESHGFSLQFSIEDGIPLLSYDPDAMKQILLSLLDNSIKFSADSPDKSLEIFLSREGDRVAWGIRDRGPGVPASELEKVFQDFYRIENEMTRKTKGTGIGLAMSRMLAEAMGAHINARNRPGGGLEVRILFPLAIPMGIP